MKRIAAVVIAVIMGFSTLGFLPEAQAAASVHRKAEFKLMKKINKYRAKKGLDRVALHVYIRRESRQHSMNMSNQGFFSHAGFDGRADRITKKDPGIDGFMCENIAWASGYSNFKQVWKLFFKGWKKSTGHRQCMLDRQQPVSFRSDSAGIGITRDGNMWLGTYIAANDRTPGWTKADRN